MSKTHIATALLLALNAACSRVAHWDEERWSAESKKPEPRVESLGSDLTDAKLGKQTVELRRQEVAGVPIEGSFVKTLSDETGKNVWLRGKILNEDHLPSERIVRQLLSHQPRALKNSAKLVSKLNCEFRGGTKPELRFRRAWRLLFLRECETKEGQLFEIAINTRGKVFSKRTLGSAFADMTSVSPKIYPKGPKISTLEPTKINVSSLPGFLINPRLEVISDADLSFPTLAALNNAVPEDDRFDMVEAYYFASRALTWAEKHLGYKSDNLRIRTQVGSPDHSNLAFYFGNEVRLGSGDGVTFNHLPWDPSIVTHETMHSVIDALTHLPLGEGEGGSLQEGLADTLTALQLEDPQMGAAAFRPAPFERTLADQTPLSAKNGGLYHDSLILSGALWEIHQRVSKDTAEKLTIYLLAHLVPTSGFADVNANFKTWLTLPENKTVADSAQKILQERGWL